MNKLFYYLILIFIIVTIGCKKNKECMYSYPKIANDKYIFPVRPGSAEWNAAGSWGIGQFDPLDSIYKLCQIPSATLGSMSTIGLIQSLEDNPCLFNIFLRSNWFQGRNEVLKRLNVSWSLNKRTDAGITIVNYYETKDPNIVSCISDDSEKGRYANNWNLFDLVCTQDSILNQLDRINKKRFAKIVTEKFNVQLKYPKTFGTGKTPMIIILSQLMILENFQPYLDLLEKETGFKDFSITSEYNGDYKYLYAKILEFSTQFINS